MTVSVTPEPTPDWLQRNLFWVARTSSLSYALVVLSLIAAIGTYLVLTGSTPIEPNAPGVLWYLVVIDALLLVALAALVIGRLVQVWMGQRSGTAGARLHGRLVTIFSLVAVIPVVLTAGAAGITINLAMEAWFGNPVQRVLDNSLAVTKSYLDEHTDKLRNEILFAELNINSLNPLAIEANPQRFQETLNEIAKRLRADIAIFDSAKNEFARANPDLLNQINPPKIDEMEDARASRGDPKPTADGQLRGVAKLSVQFEFGKEYFLVVQRSVNPQIIEYQENTEDVVKRYNELEAARDEV